MANFSTKKINKSQFISSLWFYFYLSKENRAILSAAVFMGFCIQILSVLVFAATIRFFLIVVLTTGSPEYNLPYLDLQNRHEIVNFGVIILILLIIQFSLSIAYIKINSIYTQRLTIRAYKLPTSTNPIENLIVTGDLLPEGIEASNKVYEILLFYLALLSIVFYFSPLLCLITSLILLTIIYLVSLISVSNSSAKNEIKTYRSEYKKKPAYPENLIAAKLRVFKFRENLTVFTNIFGGIGLLFLISMFPKLSAMSSNLQNGEVSTLAAFSLVFSIRFLISNTRELSKLKNVLANQYKNLAHLNYNQT